jgi:molecular chaperone GrpE
MADEGVTEIAALGEAFDPALHEAVAVVHDADAKSGTIVGVTQRGYLYGGRVLRPALVRVAG